MQIHVFAALTLLSTATIASTQEHPSKSTLEEEASLERCFTANGIQDLSEIPELSGCPAFVGKKSFEDVSDSEALLCGIVTAASNATAGDVLLSFPRLGLRRVSAALSDLAVCYAATTGAGFELNVDENRIDCTSERYNTLRDADGVDFYCAQSTQSLVPLCVRLREDDCECYTACRLDDSTGVCKEKSPDVSYALASVQLTSSSVFTREEKEDFELHKATALIDTAVEKARSLLSSKEANVETSAEVTFTRGGGGFVLVLEVHYVVNTSSKDVDTEDAARTVNKLGSSFVEKVLGSDDFITADGVKFDTKSLVLENDKWDMEIDKKRKVGTKVVASVVVIALVLVIVVLFEATIIFNLVTGPSGYSVDDAVVQYSTRVNSRKSNEESLPSKQEAEGSSSSSSSSENEGEGKETVTSKKKKQKQK